MANFTTKMFNVFKNNNSNNNILIYNIVIPLFTIFNILFCSLLFNEIENTSSIGLIINGMSYGVTISFIFSTLFF